MASNLEFNPPKGLSLTGDVAQNWSDFKRKFDMFLKANKFLGDPDDVKIAMLLSSVGDEAVHVFDTLPMEEIDRTVYQEVINAFDGYCNQREMKSASRFEFLHRRQQEGESFDHFRTELSRMARICRWREETNIEDALVRELTFWRSPL